jgi:DNA-binding MarR family transcriptional regulator
MWRMTDVVDHEYAPRTRPATDDPLITLVELLFFAYRDFTAEADEILAEYKLGRAHHRVLHFVHRHPGLRVTDLLSILKITKQSLGRVLNELIEGGWIENRPDADDRRARRLTATASGEALALRLARHQVEQVSAALNGKFTVPGVRADSREDQVRRFLYALIADTERDRVRGLITSRERAGLDKAER